MLYFKISVQSRTYLAICRASGRKSQNSLPLAVLHAANCKFLNDLYTRLEIISDVVSERHVAEKFRYHIGNTDTTSVFSDTTSIFRMWYRKKPMWYRYFRCGIGKNRCGIGISDVVSELFRYVLFPIPHRKLFLTVHYDIHIYKI